MTPKVVVQNLEKRYRDVHAVRGVTFEIRDGDIFGLLGPNGAGKTTTVECILGLREPDAGHIEVCGIDARRHPHEVKQRIGAALQTTALQDRITPREALALFASFYRKPASVDALLQRFALAEKADAPYDGLSGGQRQRLALALAFINNPELVFLDEPTAGLDPQARRELHREIAQMKQDGHTVLMTTHYLDEAEQLCDRVAIIDRGRIIADGAPAELIARSRQSQSVSLTTNGIVGQDLLARLPDVRDVSVDGRKARFRTTNTARSVGTLLSQLEAEGLAVSELHVQTASLEDLFIELTGAAARD